MMQRGEKPAYPIKGVTQNISMNPNRENSKKRPVAPPPPPPMERRPSSVPPPPPQSASSASTAPPPPPPSVCPSRPKASPIRLAASTVPPPPPPQAYVTTEAEIEWPSQSQPTTNWSIGVLTTHPRQYTVKDILDESYDGAEFLTANYAFDDDVLNDELGDIELLTEGFTYDD